jgi:hypothetical protein
VIERDYIMRLIAELGAVLARLVARRRAREFPEALDTIDKASKQLLGAETAILEAFSDEQLIHFFGRDPNMAPARWYAVATFLDEKAGVLRDMGRAPQTRDLEAKALSLLLESLRLEEAQVQPDHTERIDRLLERLAGVELTAEVEAKVAWYRGWKEAKAGLSAAPGPSGQPKE